MYPFFSKGRFANFPGEQSRFAFLRCLLMFFQTRLTFHGKVSLDEWSQKLDLSQREKNDNPEIIWIGHSTFLISIGGYKIITDPLLGDINMLFKRIVPAGLNYQSVPEVDVVLISHNHRDHMDERSLMAIKKKNPHVQIYVPQGDKAWFDKRGFAHVRECMWWDEYSPSPSVNAQESLKISFLPAFHWSQRGVFDHNRSLWGSYMIQSSSKTIYFGGDTAYSKHFSAIAQEFPHIDMALMPIGPCEPHQWMKYSHMNSEEACQAFVDLGARQFVPMHWGAFWFGTDHPLLPIKRLESWWQNNKELVKNQQLHVLKIGQSLDITNVPPQTPLVEISRPDMQL